MKFSIVDDSEEKITETAVANSATQVVPQGCLLIVVRSGILKHSIPVALTGRSLALNQDMKAFIPKGPIQPQYLRYFILGMEKLLLTLWRKEGATVESLEFGLVANTQVPVPPAAVQEAIAAFLDRETARIDALIAKKERLLALLEEKRTALITRAVTKGLDPAVPMKESGVEWLGQMPRHWQILPLRQLFRQRDERSRPELPLLEVSLVSGVTVREFSDEHIERKASDPSTYKVAHTGDIVFNKMRMWQGAVGVAPTDGLVSPDYVVASPRRGVNSDYFVEVFRTSFFKTEVYRFSHGIHDDRNRLYWEDFKALHVPAPPVSEQGKIMRAVRSEDSRTVELSEKVKAAIALLREYRTVLISAAVTGQIEVTRTAETAPPVQPTT